MGTKINMERIQCLRYFLKKNYVQECLKNISRYIFVFCKPISILRIVIKNVVFAVSVLATQLF